MTAILSKEEMRGLSIKYDLKLLMNVFHSSEGYEFRRKVQDGFECIGIIIGPINSTIYRRKLSSRYVLLHERLWWLGNLFGKRLGKVEHTPIATIPSAELNKPAIESMICQYVPSLRR